MRAALYSRVSTQNHGQDAANQLEALRVYAKHQGFEIVAEYVDEMSGSKFSDRKQFLALFKAARLREFDIVLFWALDRFSREGVLATLNHLQVLTSAGVEWRSYTEQYLDSTGIFRDAIIAILAALAKQETIRIRERTMAGLARIRLRCAECNTILKPPHRKPPYNLPCPTCGSKLTKGVKLGGNRLGRRTIDHAEVQRAYIEVSSIRKVAKRFRLGKDHVMAILKGDEWPKPPKEEQQP